MSRDKQIEEMRKLADEMGKAISTVAEQRYLADERKLEAVLKENGWRKASEVAEEIFVEIDKHIQEKKKAISMFKDGEDDFYDGEIHALEVFAHLLAELKKKYTEGKEEIPPYVRMEVKALPAILKVKYTEEGKCSSK